MDQISQDEQTALNHARHLAENGVPVFIAKPALDDDQNWLPDGGHHGSGYWLPKQWQMTRANPKTVDRWQPGQALCAVMGHTVDLLDVDPRSNGEESMKRLRSLAAVPSTYGTAATPSGGSHDFIAALNVRSMDRVLPGIDVKAGDSEGNGRGFAFIAPTVKLSKATGELVPYVWEVPPELTQLTVVGGDESGTVLRDLIERRQPKPTYSGPAYEGPSFEDLTPDERTLAESYQDSILGQWSERLAEAEQWVDGVTDEHGRGWEALTRDAAWTVARLAITPWVPLTDDAAQATFEALLPDALAADVKCRGKFTSTLLEKAASQPVEDPWWQGFLPPTDAATGKINPDDLPAFPPHPDDAYLAPWMVLKGLGQNWCWGGSALRWMHWDGRRWEQRSEERLREAVRDVIVEVCKQALATIGNQRRLNEYISLRSNGRIGALSQLMRGVSVVEADQFDCKPDLLNVANGVVDLRTGDLLPHDRDLHLTKLSETRYVPAAQHPDWDQCLEALEPDVGDWMQVRVGQAATGYATSDDVLPVSQGAGSNGKSTFLAAIRAALGEHVTLIPDKLIRASPNDHPTELMTLFGARVAVIDETPEVATLNVQRLKAVIGSERMIARQVHKDNVEWSPTHSLFVMTNYVPTVAETDWGTWRRLLLVKFTKTFPQDDAFRARIAHPIDGLREAVLAWVVRGALRWYQNSRVIPPPPAQVVKDTQAWRLESDVVLAFYTDKMIFDRESCVTARDLLDELNTWLVERSQRPWGEKLLNARFGTHQETTRNTVVKYQHQKQGEPDGLSRPKDQIVPVPSRPVVWRGLRWRTEQDD